jgi:hypothetical protein
LFLAEIIRHNMLSTRGQISLNHHRLTSGKFRRESIPNQSSCLVFSFIKRYPVFTWKCLEQRRFT